MTKKDGAPPRARNVVAVTTLPEPMRDAIDGLASVRLIDRSAWLREAVVQKLTAEGADVLQLAGVRA